MLPQDTGLLEDSKFLVCNLVSLGVHLHVYRWLLLTIYSREMRESGSGPSPKPFSAQRSPAAPPGRVLGDGGPHSSASCFPKTMPPFRMSILSLDQGALGILYIGI